MKKFGVSTRDKLIFNGISIYSLRNGMTTLN